MGTLACRVRCPKGSLEFFLEDNLATSTWKIRGPPEMMFQHYLEQLQYYHLFKPFVWSLYYTYMFINYLAAIWKQFQPSLLVSVKLAPLSTNSLMISKFNLVHDSIRGVLHWQVNQQCTVSLKYWTNST